MMEHHPMPRPIRPICAARMPWVVAPATLLFLLATTTNRADDWPQWRGPNRDGVWKEQGLLEKFPSTQIKIRWRVPVSNGYSGPTVAGGRVYITDRVVEPKEQERVHCFDWRTGRRLW